jgi:hypothetical protein
VELTTWGEELIERKIPSGDVRVEDGWEIEYTKFVVHLASVRVVAPGGRVVGEMRPGKLFDHRRPGVKAAARLEGIEAGSYELVFEIGPVKADSDAKAATEEDKQAMLRGGVALLAEGTLVRGGVRKTFSWGFPTSTRYEACEGERGGARIKGVRVPAGGADAVEITIHGDHLFYDDLSAPTAKLRADAIAAADTDGDGKVTLDELARVQLAAIPAGTYGTGGAPGVGDLRAFVQALARTVAHVRGEGECAIRLGP